MMTAAGTIPPAKVLVVGAGVAGLQAIATAKRLGLNLPVIVLDDRWLALIRIKQVRKQFGVYGTELQAEEYRSPPEHYFGVPALGVSDAQNLEKAVKEALKAKHPTVIEALVNSDHYLETVFD